MRTSVLFLMLISLWCVVLVAVGCGSDVTYLDALSVDAEALDVMSSDSAEDAIAIDDTRTPLDISGDVAIEPTDTSGEDDAAAAVDGGTAVDPQDTRAVGDIWVPSEDTVTTSPDSLDVLDVGESLDAVPSPDTEGITDVGTPSFDTGSSNDIEQMADTGPEPADAGTPSGQNNVGDIEVPADTDEPPKDVTQPPDTQLKPGDVTSGKDSIGATEPDIVSKSDTSPGWSISDTMPGKPDLVPQENEQSCSADCAGKICGSDGCGGSCGSCSGFKVCTDFGAACAAPEGEQSYRVGVDYHATGADFDTAFLSRYHEPGVRDDVLAQLQGMANEGVKIISTRMWLTNAPGAATPEQPYRWEFPPSDQQVDNLNQFVNDVAGTVSTGGQYLDVHLGLLHLWCARYRTGSPTTTLGECGLTAEEYTASMLESFDRVIDAVAGIYRPDGQHAVSLFYMDGEILAAADDNDPAVVNEKKNIRWFLQTHYPDFTQKARAAGIIPSVYFLVNPSESHALQNDYADSYLPILHQRRSMYWLYRSVKFMKDANLEVPARIDFSMYTYYPYDFSNPATIVNRIFDDLEATLGPLLGTPLRYAIAETPYYEDVAKRRRMAKAIAAERDLRGSNPEFVTFWTTPYGNGLTPPVGYPFDIDVWYGDDLIAPFGGLNPSFEVAATNAQTAEEWVLSWQVGGASGWSVQRTGGGAYDGSFKLRFSAGQCDVCDGNWDGVYARSAKIDVTPGDTVMVRFMEKNSTNLEGQVGVPGYSGPVATLLGYTASGQDKVLAQVGMPYGGWKYRRHVMVERIPADVVQVALRFGLIDLWSKIMDVDFIH